jgi:hypothetical protein
LTDLPFVDEHTIDIAAGVDAVWPALLETVDGLLAWGPSSRFVRIVGGEPRTASGPRPLAGGSTLPGFRVAAAEPGSELALVGRHRFSTYSLIFRLDQISADQSRLRAETRAAFPGVAGRLYRALVIGTRGHVVGVRGILARVKRESLRRR